MQGKVEKRCLGHRVLLFTNKNASGYENKVRRHLEREGKNPDSFVMGKLPWGQRVPNSPFIEHKGEYYLQAVFLASGSVEYRATSEIIFNEYMGIGMTHYCEGDYIPKQNIPGLPDKDGSEHQGLDNSVIVRSYKLSSIVALRAMSEELT
jgi:hypothetical protein